MAHFAQLDENNIVTQVVVVNNNTLDFAELPESEEIGVEFCKSLFGEFTVWKQTSFNANFRKNYAGVGFTYDPVRNAFIPPKQFTSWILNEDTCQWHPPISRPDDENLYNWNEETLSWELVK